MKLDVYNKRLLAIIGTTVLLIAIVGLIAVTVVLIDEASRFFDSEDGNNELVVDKEVAEKKKDQLKLVHTGYPDLVDSASGLFVIPLSQLSVPHGFVNSDILNSFGSGGYIGNSRFFKTINNLVLYSQITGETKTIFNEKLLITDYRLIGLDSSLYLFTEMVSADSDGDGILSDEDYRTVEFYNLETGISDRFETEGFMFKEFKISPLRNAVFLLFYQDANANKKVNAETDPVVLWIYTPKMGFYEVLPQSLLEQVNTTIN